MKLPRREFLHLAAGAGALPAVSRFAWAESYPSRPIHLIVGFTPGAAADVTARLLGESMGPLLGQQIAVENKPGGGSSIAADYVAHAAKDGYTLFLATLSIIINQIINPNPAFDMTRDLAPIALLSSGAVVLVDPAKCSMPRWWAACRILPASCSRSAPASNSPRCLIKAARRR
jgi:tripartite-type tricarboxylate transporter receptor subunit TctC